MELDDVLKVVEDLREDYQREEDRALRNRNLEAAIHALAGKDACDRIRRTLEVRADWTRQIRAAGGR